MCGLTMERLRKHTDSTGRVIPSMLHNLATHAFPHLSTVSKQQKEESSLHTRRWVSQKTPFHRSCFESHGTARNYTNQLCCSTAESFLWERAVVTCDITSPASPILALMKRRERAYLIAIKNLLCFHLCSTELTVTARSDHSYLTPLSNEKK